MKPILLCSIYIIKCIIKYCIIIQDIFVYRGHDIFVYTLMIFLSIGHDIFVTTYNTNKISFLCYVDDTSTIRGQEQEEEQQQEQRI